jgi:hypothetical protein
MILLFYICSMKQKITILLLVLPLLSFSEDWMWWNIKHGWQVGMSSWRTFIHISPGYLGPNALPVPEIKKGLVLQGNQFELGCDLHFRTGDPTQDISAKYYRSFADDKIAIEIYGVLLEHYHMSDTIRDERIARDYDGKGFAVGDLYFSTLIQLAKDRKFPDTMLRMACRTASGNQLEAARYSDCPGYFFDFSFSKKYTCQNPQTTFRPYLSLGFYCWQTNDDMDFQDDAYMYGGGAELKWASCSLSNCLSGYSGYKHLRDKPMVYTLDFVKKVKRNAFRFQFLWGLNDWTYKTFKFSYIINLKK